MGLLPESYAPGAAGHLAHSAQIAKKLNDIVHLEADFATVGGGADETTKIQNAIDAAVGGMLLIPYGTWRASALNVPSNVTILLAGILKPITTFGGDFLRLYDSDDVQIIGLGGTIDGDKANNVAANGTNLISIRGQCHRVLLGGILRLINAKGTTSEGGTYGDGYYLGTGNGTVGVNGEMPQWVWVEEGVTCDGNVRSGGAVTSCKHGRFKGQYLNTSGNDTGTGFQLEPNNDSPDTLEDIQFDVYVSGNEKGVQLANGQQAVCKGIRGRIHSYQNRKYAFRGLLGNTTEDLEIEIHSEGDGVDDGVLANKTEAVLIDGMANSRKLRVRPYITGAGLNGLTLTQCRTFEIDDPNINLCGEDGIEVGYVTNGKMHGRINGGAIFNNGTRTTGTFHGISCPGHASHPNYYMEINGTALGNRSEFSATATQQDNININANAKGVRCIHLDHDGQLGSDINNGAGNDTFIKPVTGAEPFGVSTTAAASLRVPHGTAPSSPVNGDMWTTTAGLYVRINGVTVGPLS